MIDHINLYVADLARSRAFCTPVLVTLGYREVKNNADGHGFGITEGLLKTRDPGGDFWIVRGGPAHAPLPHVAFTALTREAVRAFHAAALAVGGRDNGGPGLRPHYNPNYYAAFVLDPDGYNIEATCHAAE